MLKLYHIENPKIAVGGNGGAGEADNGQKKSLLDKLTNLNAAQKPAEPIDYSKLENAKTKSIVESRRESASEELRQLQALEEQRLAQQRAEIKMAAAKKTGTYITVTIICVVLLICLVFFFLSLVKYLRKPTSTEISGNTGEISETVKIGTYTCKKADCESKLDLADGRQLIKDDSYILYNQDAEESFVLTLEGDYVEFNEFNWGEKHYLLAKNADGLGAIFSVTDNKYVTDAVYESILGDASDSAYDRMNWVVGKLIIAKRSGSYRLVNIEDGSEKVSGVLGVFATQSGYYIAREEGGVLRVFNSEKVQIILTSEGEQLYERDGYLIVANEKQFNIFKNNGETVKNKECSFYDELKGQKREALVNFLNGNSAYFHIY